MYIMIYIYVHVYINIYTQYVCIAIGWLIPVAHEFPCSFTMAREYSSMVFQRVEPSRRPWARSRLKICFRKFRRKAGWDAITVMAIYQL